MWGVRFSLDNLMGYPWIKSAVDGGELLLHGLYFDMGSGELLYFDAESETYVPMVNACASGHLIREEAIEDWKLGKEDGLFPNEKPSPFSKPANGTHPSPTGGFFLYRIPAPGFRGTP